MATQGYMGVQQSLLVFRRQRRDAYAGIEGTRPSDNAVDLSIIEKQFFTR